MDLEGIEKEKERIVKIDNLLLSIIGAEDKENSFSDENIEKVLRSDMSVVTKDFFYRIVELSSIETTNSSERKRLMQLCDDFMRVVQKIDPKRHADIEAAVQIEFTAEVRHKPTTPISLCAATHSLYLHLSLTLNLCS